MSSILLEPAIEQRLAERARRDGMPKADLAQLLIEDGLDDLDDLQVAAERLARPVQPLTSAQARRALGLDD